MPCLYLISIKDVITRELHQTVFCHVQCRAKNIRVYQYSVMSCITSAKVYLLKNYN